jgi:hypothetical protein
MRKKDSAVCATGRQADQAGFIEGDGGVVFR